MDEKDKRIEELERQVEELQERIDIMLENKTSEAEIEGSGHNWFFVCGECHTALNNHDKYCRECGRLVKWA